MAAGALAGSAAAQDISINLGPGNGGVTERAVQLIALLTVLSIAPSILIMMTSFTRIVVVLSLLRTAMGTATAPPNAVIIALAMFLTAFVMGPVLQKSYDDGVRPLIENQIGVEDALQRASVPLRGFMQKNVREKDLKLFMDLSGEAPPATPDELSLRILVPAFMISELKRAFEIGFLLFLPFLIIDLVVASVLMSMGMMMLPPVVVSLPFKLIFFVLVDGWSLVAGSLVQSYGGQTAARRYRRPPGSRSLSRHLREAYMRVLVNGVRLYFDVEGAALVPDGPAMRQKPTVLLLHGGPGFDHTSYKPAYSALTDIAQLVYLDHRGNGRSEDGPQELWTLAQWGDDVKAFCDIVGIVDPIVLGVSFGGFVAMSYATRHPEHPAKLILISTEAKGQSYLEQRVALFESLGGPEVGALARRRFLETGGHKDQASVEAWQRLALPLYTRKGHDPDMMARALRRPAVLQWFTRPGGEVTSFDLVPDLHRISCPTLVMGGEDDPMTPIACQVDIAAALRPDLVRFERFADCGHGVVSDQPERAFAVIRDFILGTHG